VHCKEDYRQTHMNLLRASDQISSRICVTSFGSSDWEQSCRLAEGLTTSLSSTTTISSTNPNLSNTSLSTTFKAAESEKCHRLLAITITLSSLISPIPLTTPSPMIDLKYWHGYLH